MLYKIVLPSDIYNFIKHDIQLKFFNELNAKILNKYKNYIEKGVITKKYEITIYNYLLFINLNDVNNDQNAINTILDKNKECLLKHFIKVQSNIIKIEDCLNNKINNKLYNNMCNLYRSCLKLGDK